VKGLLGRLVASGYKSETTVENRKRGAPHSGVDIRGEVGDDILAAAEGYVTFAGNTPRGLAIFIAHGQNSDGFWYSTLYFHNSENLVRNGDRVERGQVIAHLGDSGSRTIPHVHFQVNKSPTSQWTRDEQYTGLDPRPYWHAEKICFDPGERYPARPLRFTLPVRCAE
jgi:murein DD-endopeptidase MepM/ murein hydrolase activator NlpD